MSSNDLISNPVENNSNQMNLLATTLYMGILIGIVGNIVGGMTVISSIFSFGPAVFILLN